VIYKLLIYLINLSIFDSYVRVWLKTLFRSEKLDSLGIVSEKECRAKTLYRS